MKYGYTLLEVLFVITIILLMLGGGTISYTRFNAQKGLDKDVQAFKDVLSDARQKTIDRDIGNTLNCTTFAGYRVEVRPSTSTYNLYRLCTGLNIPALNTYKLDLSRFSGGANMNIDFQSPYGTLVGSPRVIRFTSTRNNGCHEVLINAAGVISDQPC